jgi:hypothetical protein
MFRPRLCLNVGDVFRRIAKVNERHHQLNDLHGKLRDVGTLLQSEEPFEIFEDAFRLWPKSCPDDLDVAAWCATRSENMPKRMEILRAHRPRPDVEKYEVALRKVLRLFGEGIHESPERTMGHYLSRTNGKFQNSNLAEKARKMASKIISHNNWAERPFAVAKALAHQRPSMSLSHLFSLAHARVNGTCRSPTAERNDKKRKKRTMERPGAAVMAHPAAKTAVAKLCCIRSASLGGVVKMRRELRDIDIRAAWAHSAKHHEDKSLRTKGWPQHGQPS